VVSKKTWRGAFAVLLALCAPLSGLAQDVPAHNPDGLISISGTVERTSADELAIKPRTGTDVMTVKLMQSFHLYGRVSGDLSHLKDTNFVGVTSVKQPDGTERASAIGILPEELRGVGEGSYMMNQAAGAMPSRMTNGNVSASRMTNGTASESRMSNGSVKRTGRINADGPVSGRCPENHGACRYACSRVSTHCNQAGRGRQGVCMGTESS